MGLTSFGLPPCNRFLPSGGQSIANPLFGFVAESVVSALPYSKSRQDFFGRLPVRASFASVSEIRQVRSLTTELLDFRHLKIKRGLF